MTVSGFQQQTVTAGPDWQPQQNCKWFRHQHLL